LKEKDMRRGGRISSDYTDPGYMLGDYEFPGFFTSTDDYGGSLSYDIFPIAGKARSDMERAVNHYNITPEEYFAHPELYPLPERGSAFHLAGPGQNYPYFTGGTFINPGVLPPPRRYTIELPQLI
jgi:hypothetical protein